MELLQSQARTERELSGIQLTGVLEFRTGVLETGHWKGEMGHWTLVIENG